VGRRTKWLRRRRLGVLAATASRGTQHGGAGAMYRLVAPAAAGQVAGAAADQAPGAPVVRAHEAPDDGKHGKRTLAALILGLCAIATAVGSGADFSARTANPSNTFSAGSLSMENSKDGTAIFSPTNMKPGGAPQTGVVDIKNTGSIDGAFTLTRDQLTNSDSGADNPTPFATKVAVAIVDCGKYSTWNGPYGPEQVTPTCGDGDDSTLYLGSLANENSPLALGTYHPGEQHRYQFEGSLDSSAGNEYEGDGASARYVFDAAQTQ
jgi:spore coat-associated protein N